MNFEYFVQYTSLLKRCYWLILISPSGPASGSRRCCNMESWGPSIHSFEAFNMNFGYFGLYTSLLKRHYWKEIIGIVWYPTQGQLHAEVLKPWHPLFWSFILRYFVPHASPLKKHYWLFLIPPSGSRRCWKMKSWGRGIHSFPVHRRDQRSPNATVLNARA